jgi:hypothetical protein
MKNTCTHKQDETPKGYQKFEDKGERGLEQRQCPVCKLWYFHGEFGKGWAKGIKYSEPQTTNL